MAGTALVSPPDKDNVPLVSKKQLNKKNINGDINNMVHFLKRLIVELIA